MRLTSLSLTRYGNFESERITFDPKPGALNLLLAPNGAGKSVLRSAFCDLLFGIGGQTPMGFRYGYPGMRISADAIGADGTTFAFARRKGQGNTLVDAAGTALDPTTITRLLGRTDRTMLERLFALDTERLREGEDELLASNGALADALESGAGGFHQARRLRKSLEDIRDTMAPTRRSSQRPFYLALDRFVDARKRVTAGLLRPDQWLKQQQELEAADQRQGEQNRIADEASAEIARLERIRRITPWLAAHDAAAAWLAEHPDAPVLDPALAIRLADTRSAIVVAEHKAQRERETVGRLAEQLAQITVDQAVLAEAEEIDRLVDGAGAARKAAVDLPDVASEAAARRADVAARLRDLGSSLPVERASEAVPPRAAASRARRLINGYAARQEVVQAAPARIAALEQDRNAALAQLAALAQAGDLSDLEGLVKEIGADGRPDRAKREAAALRVTTADALAAALARVPGWTGGADTLVALAPLLPEMYQRMADELAAARAEAARRLDALTAARQGRDEARERLARQTGAGPLPDDAGLAHARTRRDTGWQLIFRRAFTPDPPTPGEERDFTGPLPLPIAYERAVSAADNIADRRVLEAGAIAQVENARTVLGEAEARVQGAEAAHRVTAETQQATARAWAQVCSALPLGDDPALRDVHAFLALRDRVIEARQKHAAADATDRALDSRHADWAARLAVLLGTAGAVPREGAVPAGHDVGAPGETGSASAALALALPRLLAEADKRLVEAQRSAKAHAAAEARRDAVAKSLDDARARQGEAETALAAWRADWARTMQELGRAADTDPDRVEDDLQIIAELDQARKDAASLAERVAGMTRDNARFTAAAATLVMRVAPELADGDPFAIATGLRGRLQHAREQAKAHALIAQELQATSVAAETAARHLDEQQAAQHAVLSLIGVEDIDTAETRLALSAERARHAGALAEAEVKLREAGDLLAVTHLRAEVSAVAADDITARIDHAVEQRQAGQAAAQEAVATASALRQQMRQAAADTGARDAAADQQAAVATIGRVLEEALVHHLAAEMLDRSLAAVERDSDTALLRRISDLFGRLTSGAYARVMTEMDDAGQPRLTLLQRDYPDERQLVRELSEGTRDQLYLALRLAAIEEHTASAPPLPFIGDDILQTFDDDRALAAMQALREVSEKVQVILLTHHRHVLDLAARLPVGAVHLCRIGVGAVGLAAQ